VWTFRLPYNFQGCSISTFYRAHYIQLPFYSSLFYDDNALRICGLLTDSLKVDLAKTIVI
jgi:hypothetical protein